MPYVAAAGPGLWGRTETLYRTSGEAWTGEDFVRKSGGGADQRTISVSFVEKDAKCLTPECGILHFSVNDLRI